MPYGRKSARSRNNQSVKTVTDSARTFKTIELDFNRADWDQLREKFNILPVVHRDEDGEIIGMNTEYICLRARPKYRGSGTTAPLLEVDGVKFPIEHRDFVSTEHLNVDQEEKMECLTVADPNMTPEERQATQEELFEECIHRNVDDMLQDEGSVKLVFIVHAKLKVELFETTLPDDAPVVFCYAGPLNSRDTHENIPLYVPPEAFLDLNRTAKCWVAKTMLGRGGVQTTQHEVGMDHCFLPGETIYFRNKEPRFNEPIWVVSQEEAEAFERLTDRMTKASGQAFNYLVKSTLKAGDRFVLVPAYERRRGDLILENEELTEKLLESHGGPISEETARQFKLRGKEVVALKIGDSYLAERTTKRGGQMATFLTLCEAKDGRPPERGRFNLTSNSDGTVTLEIGNGGYLVADEEDNTLHIRREGPQPLDWGKQDHKKKPKIVARDARLEFFSEESSTHACRVVIRSHKGLYVARKENCTEKFIELCADRERCVSEGVLTFEVERFVNIKVSQWDCSCLSVELPSATVVGCPINAEEEQHGFEWPRDDPRGGKHNVEYYMDLRKTLGFNALGLLHSTPFTRDITQYYVECPLQRTSVMTPQSRLLFLDRMRMRDEIEQKAFRSVADAIRAENFLKPIKAVAARLAAEREREPDNAGKKSGDKGASNREASRKRRGSAQNRSPSRPSLARGKSPNPRFARQNGAYEGGRATARRGSYTSACSGASGMGGMAGGCFNNRGQGYDRQNNRRPSSIRAPPGDNSMRRRTSWNAMSEAGQQQQAYPERPPGNQNPPMHPQPAASPYQAAPQPFAPPGTNTPYAAPMGQQAYSMPAWQMPHPNPHMGHMQFGMPVQQPAVPMPGQHAAAPIQMQQMAYQPQPMMPPWAQPVPMEHGRG